MKYTVLKDKVALLKELNRRYGDIKDIESIISGEKECVAYKANNEETIIFMYIQDYINNKEDIKDQNIVILSDIEIDEYIFFELMQNRQNHIELLVTNKVARLYLEYFNAKMRYKIGCKKTEK